MSRVSAPRLLSRKQIADLLRFDPSWLIRKEGERYEKEVRDIAARLASVSGRRLVLLSGPSASGKTTTAFKLEERLRALGREACTVSLDNFYRGYGKAPRLPDGSYDYESVEALDLPLLETCMQELLHNGETQLPVFDFHTHSPKEERIPLRLAEGSVVIFEGIHALNPLLRRHLPEQNLFKIFINVMSPVMDGDEVLLSARDLRLVRRLLRDIRYRNSSIENTMDMWRQVVRGEDLYLFPFAGTADVSFDTTQAFEPAMLGAQLLPLLSEVSETSIYAATIVRLIDALSRFEPLAEDLLPPESLLKEFVG